jgi:hypothetical protein
MAKSIISVLTNVELKDKLISQGYITASEHSSKEFGDKLEKLYMHVIENYKKKKAEKMSLARKLLQIIKK